MIQNNKPPPPKKEEKRRRKNNNNKNIYIYIHKYIKTQTHTCNRVSELYFHLISYGASKLAMNMEPSITNKIIKFGLKFGPELVELVLVVQYMLWLIYPLT